MWSLLEFSYSHNDLLQFSQWGQKLGNNNLNFNTTVNYAENTSTSNPSAHSPGSRIDMMVQGGRLLRHSSSDEEWRDAEGEPGLKPVCMIKCQGLQARVQAGILAAAAATRAPALTSLLDRSIHWSTLRPGVRTQRQRASGDSRRVPAHRRAIAA